MENWKLLHDLREENDRLREAIEELQEQISKKDKELRWYNSFEDYVANEDRKIWYDASKEADENEIIKSFL